MQRNQQYLNEPSLEYSNLDLLAIMIGGSKAESTAQNLLKKYLSLKKIAQLDARTLALFPGIGNATAAKIHAGLRAGRRALFWEKHSETIQSPQDVYTLISPHVLGKQYEELWSMYLSRNKKVLCTQRLTQGNDRYTIVDPKHIYQHALQIGAAGIILIHNHPSGDPSPSEQDIIVTRRIEQAGTLLGIPLVDHIIIGDGRFVSLNALHLLQGVRT